jgi:hypothetical protein
VPVLWRVKGRWFPKINGKIGDEAFHLLEAGMERKDLNPGRVWALFRLAQRLRIWPGRRQVNGNLTEDRVRIATRTSGFARVKRLH